MPRPFRPVMLLVVVALLAMASSGVWAQDRRGGRPGGSGEPTPSPGMQGSQDRDRAAMQMPPPQARPGRRDDALSDSIRSVERSTRGQVLSAERIQSDGRDLNRIKVIDGRGRVRVYMDDPQQRRRPSPTRGDDN